MRALLSIAVAAAALTFVSVSPAAAGASNYGQATLTIVTVPKLAGVHFALDGRTFVTGRQGIVRIATTQGSHLLQILDTKVHAPGVRSTFVRWEDNKYTATRTLTINHNTVIDAGFQQTVRVSFAFADLDGRPVVGRVSRLTLSNTLGSRVSFAPSWPQWLRATNVARRFTGLEPTLIQYSIERALVNSSNVVNQSQQRFYPLRTRRVTARLLLYSARVSVHDFLFGTSTGNQLDLVYPSGAEVAYPLKGRTLLFSSLPRGTYGVRIDAGGYVPSVSLALSKNQVLDVKVISYLDMLLLLAVVLGLVSVLILVPRPFLRLRLRSLGSGRQPTPDDLEPVKPLSGARKTLIDRYMPEPDASAPAVPRMPTPAPRPIAVPASGESVERSVWGLPSRSLETAVDSLRRRRERLADVPGLAQRLRPAAGSQAPEDALKGERIELINVYMQEHLTTAQDTESPAPPARQPEAVANAEAAARSEAPPTTAEPADAAPTAPARLAPVIELRAAPAVEEDAASAVEESPAPPRKEVAPAVEKSATPAVEEKPAPLVEEAAASAVEESPAPPRKRAAPARRKRVAPAVEESATPAVEESPAPARKRAAPARRKRVAAVEESAAPTIEEKPAPSVEEDAASSVEESPAPARKRAAPARRKRAVPAVEESATPAEKTTAAARRKPAASAKAKTTGQSARERAPAKKKSTTAATSRKSTAPAKQTTQAATKPKPRARTTKKATTPAATQRRARRTSVPATPRKEAARDGKAGATTNGAASSDDFARLLTAAAVEALQEDSKKATATWNPRSSTGSVSR
ncbi:MAG TPA: hypothetical protein VGP69_03895 [Gaiellaceae bacterium]|nr:hypothetical protein [Gaiellaceae bacterium]